MRFINIYGIDQPFVASATFNQIVYTIGLSDVQKKGFRDEQYV